MRANSQYLAKKAADNKSYLWDKIIEEIPAMQFAVR